MPWTFRRIATLVSVAGGSLSLANLHAGLREPLHAVLSFGVERLRSTHEGLNAWGIPWWTLGLGDLLLLVGVSLLLAALLYESPPRWLRELGSVVRRRGGTEGRRRSRRLSS